MKIILGTNTFGKYHRQDIAVQSWLKLGIDVYDIQFTDTKSEYNLKNISCLTRSSQTCIKKSKKRLPFVNDILKALAEIECDYFVFTNSDVIIMPSLLQYIEDTEPDCMSCSRLDINEISSFENIKTEAKPVRWEIAGYDTFIFKRSWFLENQKLFRDYYIGRPIWDVVYTGIMKIYGKDFKIGNSNPPFCMHIHHGLAAVTTDTPEKDFNIKNGKKNLVDKFAGQIMSCFIRSILIYRQPMGSFLTPLDNEAQIEKEFFSHFKF